MRYVILFLWGIACTDSDPKTDNPNQEPGTEEPENVEPEETSLELTQVEDDAMVYTTLWSSKYLKIEISDEVISGSIDYFEYWEDESPYCEGVLSSFSPHQVIWDCRLRKLKCFPSGSAFIAFPISPAVFFPSFIPFLTLVASFVTSALSAAVTLRPPPLAMVTS